ncbi:MAG TPA: hypothetical protein VKT32_07070, partial [Chthonomonadaceae bacterium]|nr:hypothetical protein [Chthonomonadaceae bacterium]
MKMVGRLACMAGLLCLTLIYGCGGNGGAAAGAGARYVAVDPAAGSSLRSNEATAINPSGHATGIVLVAGDYSHAVLYSRAVTNLGTLPGDKFSYGQSLNASDQVVGYSMSAGGVSRAFLYANGQMIALASAGSTASGINTQGQVVGSAVVVNGETHAVLWQNGQMSDLGTLPGAHESAANAINDNGQVVGISGGQAFLWQNGQMTAIGAFNPTAINNAGQVVGFIGVSTGTHAIEWQNGQLTDLGVYPGDLQSQATGINNAGQIVGWSMRVVNGNIEEHVFRPILW